MHVVDKKRDFIKKKVAAECTECDDGCGVCLKKLVFIDKMAYANIPTNYWFLKMGDFNGPQNVKDATVKYIHNMKDHYSTGMGLCFTGQYGTGKTYSICSILKHAMVKDFSVYYTSLNDLVHYLSDYSTQSMFYSMVTRVDFLAIDEVDSRHFSDSDQAQQYFGSNFERITRYRTQNGLPTLIASNNATLEEVFTGQYRRVIDSLVSYSTEVVPSLGKDHRKA
jgi:DNA replication protein DnaC